MDKKVICENCRYRVVAGLFSSFAFDRCSQVRSNYVHEGPESFAFCDLVNSNGDCRHYEPLEPKRPSRIKLILYSILMGPTKS